MKRAATRVLVNLAWVGLLTGGQVVAEQTDPAHAEQPSPVELPTLVDQPEPEILAANSMAASPTSFLDQAEPFDTQEMISLDGGSFGASSLGTSCAVCGGGSAGPPTWYTEQNGRVLTLSKPRAYNLGFNDTNFFGTDSDGNSVFLGTVPAPVLNIRSAPFDIAAGYATTIGHHLGRDTENRDHFIEFTYWGLNHWGESLQINGSRLFRFNPATGQTVAATGSLSSLYEESVGGFNRADVHATSYEADLDNFEVNVRLSPRGRKDRLVLHPSGRWQRECQPGKYMSYLIGLRVLLLDESFEFRSRGVIEDLTSGIAIPSNVSGDYLVSSRNELFGIQMGFDYTNRKCKWTWGTRVRAGAYVNFADQASRITTDALGDPFVSSNLDITLGARKNEASLLGEVGLFATYKLRPNVALRAGYDFMWVTGLARASEQFLFVTNPVAKVNSNGRIYTHGLTLGAEWLW